MVRDMEWDSIPIMMEPGMKVSGYKILRKEKVCIIIMMEVGMKDNGIKGVKVDLVSITIPMEVLMRVSGRKDSKRERVFLPGVREIGKVIAMKVTSKRISVMEKVTTSTKMEKDTKVPGNKVEKMDSAPISIATEASMLDYGKKGKNTEMGHLHGEKVSGRETDLKVTSKMTSEMDRECIPGVMGTPTRVNGRMESSMGRVNSNGQMEIALMGSTRMIPGMVSEFISIRMGLSMRAIGKRIKSMGRENSPGQMVINTKVTTSRE